MKKLLLLLLIGVALLGGWFLGRENNGTSSGSPSARKPLYYQSPMHPWVKSDKPGKCSICGMTLVPIYEGGSEAGNATANTHLVMLADGAPQVASIQTVAITREKLTRTLRFAGMVDDNDSRHRVLSAYTAGRIEKLFVNYEGAEVEAGQPLALFYSRELLAAAREYSLAKRQNNAPVSAIGATRLQQMGLTPEQIAKVPERAENDLFFEILAPISGTVVKRAAYEGQYVTEGESLMEIADFSTMWLQFNAYEQDLPFLRVGQKVEITLPSLPGQKLTAPITFINPNLDEMTRSIRVRADITNPKSESGHHQNHELLHKTYAQVEVLAETPDALTVPRSAILWPGDQPRVYVEKSPGIYEPRAVSLGRAGDDAWEVLDGLAEGEKVVVSGNMLIDGQAQINRLGDAIPMAAPRMKMSEQEPALDYLMSVAILTEALSKDDLATYTAALAKLPAAPAGFPQKAPEVGSDLKSTRLAFQPFSAAVSAAAQTVRGQLPQLKVFSCPMSNLAAKGLPKDAQWVQFSAVIHNPFLGQAMLDCGSEIPAP